MHFARPLPWWLGLLVAAAIISLAFAQYYRPLHPLARAQRAVLVACRLLALGALVLMVLRPTVLVAPRDSRDAVVAVLVDVSRSMRLNDVDGESRLSHARALLQSQLLPALSRRFSAELFSVGERLDAAKPDQLSPEARRSDLVGALAAVRDHYRGRQVAGIILLSDGGDTGPQSISASMGAFPPVFAIGLGSPHPPRDREVTGVAAGEQRLDQTSIDLQVSAISSGYGRTPFMIRLLFNGREVQNRRVQPMADGAPVEEVFTVSPDPTSPTVYTVEIPAHETEAVPENNIRSALVNPVGRKRRLLIVEGAPGFEHGFMKRAWTRDPSLEADAVGRKGKDAEGRDTFYVQAEASRGDGLKDGFPRRREDLYAYDALVIANVETGFFTEAQGKMAADFVGERGGGLLVVGGQSFSKRGFTGTPLEDVLPVELDARRRMSATALQRDPRADNDQRLTANKVVVTAEGENHPTMRIGGTREETRRLWNALPALAATASLGGPRPGATVLAVTTSPTGELSPVVAVQRYGRGRSMVFAGEASWRWKMLLASTDRSFEYFWRQTARWISGSSPDPVTISVPETADVGDDLKISVDVRDAAFTPIDDASVEAILTGPGGETRPLKLRLADAATHSYTSDLRVDQAGLYRISVEARRGTTMLGRALRWFHVGGVDREFVDPRLNEPWLRRVAQATGGRYLPAADASQVERLLQEATPRQDTPERRDLWHEPWAFALVVGLLSTEWILRRRWGLR
jgi:uncharacterized membrane protein